MTKEKTQTETKEADDSNPQQDDTAEVELTGATIGEQKDGIIYSNQTGNYPVCSYHGKLHMFVA